jgi:DNA-directed RNA polymerase I and III subunit RPAC2
MILQLFHSVFKEFTHQKPHKQEMSDREEDDEPMVETINEDKEQELLEDEEEEEFHELEEEQRQQEKKRGKEEEEETDRIDSLPTVEIQHGTDETVATFIFHNETHTLGNSLRHILMKNKKVDFCGYTVPHPLEDKMNLRLQTNGANASLTLIEGFVDLMSVTEHIMQVFNKRMEEFESSQLAE